MERRPAFHGDGRPWVVSQDEHGGVEWRVVAPPSFPLLVNPRSALVPELVAPHDLCPDARPPVPSEGIINAGASCCLASHLLEGAGAEEPFVEPMTGMPEWRF